MVLQGFKHSLFLGWVSGVLLLKRPSGLPELIPKRSPLTFLFIALYLTNLCLRLDYYMKHNSSLKGASMVTKFLDLSHLMGETVFDAWFRANFAFRSKLVVRLLKALETDMKKFAIHLNLSPRDRKEWKFCARLIYATLGFHLIAAILVTNWMSKILASGKGSSLLERILPRWLYTGGFFLFGELPVMCSISTTFAMVTVTTFHVLWIFYDFSESLEEQVELLNGKQKQMFVKHQLGELDSVFSVAATAMQIHNNQFEKKNTRFGGQPVTTDKLVGKLEHLKMVCGMYDKVCGPLLLGLIVRAVYVLISAANSILLYTNPGGAPEKRAKYALDLFLFPSQVLQLWLLSLGCMFRRKINERKEDIARKVIFMANLEARTDMRNVVTAFTEWDWSLTGGPGFFVVDRPLLSGVVSSLMTYVTIIFQLNAPGSQETTLEPTVNGTQSSITI